MSVRDPIERGPTLRWDETTVNDARARLVGVILAATPVHMEQMFLTHGMPVLEVVLPAALASIQTGKPLSREARRALLRVGALHRAHGVPVSVGIAQLIATLPVAYDVIRIHSTADSRPWLQLMMARAARVLTDCAATFVDGHVGGGAASQPKRKAPTAATLTPRQAQFLDALTEGLSNDEIADRFGVSATTVRNTLHALYRRIDVTNRVEAARWCLQQST